MARLGVVILFARTARIGRGKRRLARDIGDIAAWQFYHGALGRSARIVAREAGWRGLIVIDPPTAVARPGSPLGHGPAARIARAPQQGRDLGERMLRALRRAPPGPVVLIGADIPDLSIHALRRALLACRGADLVFGPATDGGFWLFGCKRALGLRLLEGVPWSSPTTLEAAIARAPKAWRVRLVDRLADVDNFADLPTRA